jgi:hypothetical protein
VTERGLAARIAELPAATETGVWQRNAAARLAPTALDGYASEGRWGSADGFPVLYLGRPTDSVVVEAYRHQVDPVIFDTDADRERFLAGLLPRVLITCAVNVTDLLDLRSATARAAVGLTTQDLASPTNDRDSYQRCQTVAQVAHQLGRHGIITPAATGLGDTLALFTDMLPAAQKPQRTQQDEHWPHLPSDPRHSPERALRLVGDDE